MAEPAQAENVIWTPQPGPQTALVRCPVFEIFFGGARGGGKLAPLDSLVLTPKDFVRMGEIKVGDSVSDPTTGGSTKVIGVYPQGVQKIWRFIFDDGASYESGADHLWAYKLANKKRPRTKKSKQREFAEQTVGLTKLANRWDFYRVGKTSELMDKQGVRIPLSEPISFTVNGRAGTGAFSDPYLCGLMLGDGSCSNLHMTSCDDEIREYLVDCGFSVHSTDLHTDGKPKSFGTKTTSPLAIWLYQHKLRHCRSWEKFIPDYVFTAAVDYRLAFLQGLMDTDGTADERGRCYFISTSQRLSEGVQNLVRSLGGKARIRQRQTKYTHKDEKLDGRPSWQVRVWHPKLSSFFRLTRKKERANDSWNGGYELTRELVKVEYVGEKEAQCIQVDSMYGLYIGDDFVVTHNTDGTLGRFIGRADRYGENCSGLMFRRERTHLVDTIERSKRLYGPLGWTWHEQAKLWRTPNGARLLFAYLENDSDAEAYQGHGYTDVMGEEIGQFPSAKPIMMMMATLRSGAGVPCQFVATGNPGGPGHHWVKQRYIDPAPLGYQVIKSVFTNPFTGSKTERERVFIPSRVTDNLYLGDEYIANLAMSGSPELVRAWLEGDWDVIAGAYFPEFSQRKHVIAPFEIAQHWLRFRSMDWGSARPFAVHWWAVSDGEDERFPRGALIAYREWYGSTGEPNVGLKMPASAVGEGIVARDGDDEIAYGVLDPAAFAEDGGPSIAEAMYRVGAKFRRADNKRVARNGAIGGWNQLRTRLVGVEGRPMIYFFSTCTEIIRTLPMLQHDPDKPEDVQTDSEDHACFVAGTIVNGKPIEEIGMLTRRNAEIIALSFDNGERIVCTPDHRFLCGDGEWKKAIDLHSVQLLSATQFKSLTGQDSTSAGSTFSAKVCDFIGRCGSRTTGLYLMVSMFITSMKIAVTTLLKTSRFYPCANTWQSTIGLESFRPEHERANGGTRSTAKLYADAKTSGLKKLASFVGRRSRLRLSYLIKQSSAIKTARPVTCVSVDVLKQRQDVYCLATKASILTVGAVIASNCDSSRYAVMSRIWINDAPSVPDGIKGIHDATLNQLWEIHEREQWRIGRI
jgi:hypothetical protein